jgi:hypothetical protein
VPIGHVYHRCKQRDRGHTLHTLFGRNLLLRSWCHILRTMSILHYGANHRLPGLSASVPCHVPAANDVRVFLVSCLYTMCLVLSHALALWALLFCLLDVRSSFPSPFVTGMVTFPSLGIVVTTDFSGSALRVMGLTPPFAPIRTVGVHGSGTTVGATAQLYASWWLTAAPWSNTTVLVPDSSGNRVIEMDVVTGFLVKVWFTGLPNVAGVAATSQRIAVAYGIDTGTTRLNMYDLSGVLKWTVGGVALALGDTTRAGLLLGGPNGLRFSRDGSMVFLTEGNAYRITKWHAATGAYLGTVGSGYSFPADVLECWAGSGSGIVVSNLAGSTLVGVDAGGTVTTAAVTAPVSTALVPGVGVLVATQSVVDGTWGAVFYLRSVVIATHPVNATTTVPASVTFTVVLTAASASTGVTYAWTKGGVAVGGNSTSYTYTGAAVDGGQTFAIVCTVTHAMGTAMSNPATLTVQVCDM